jgi:hypothetical protein
MHPGLWINDGSASAAVEKTVELDARDETETRKQPHNNKQDEWAKQQVAVSFSV